MIVAETVVIDNEAWEDTNAVCAYCKIVRIPPGQEYCGPCADEICQYLYRNNLD